MSGCSSESKERIDEATKWKYEGSRTQQLLELLNFINGEENKVSKIGFSRAIPLALQEIKHLRELEDRYNDLLDHI